MKIKNKKNKKKVIIISIVVIILIAVSASAYYFINKNSENNSQNNNVNTAKKSKSDKQQAKDLEENPEYKETKTNTDTPAPVTTDESTGKKTVQMVASVNISNGILYIRGGINNSVEYSGTCYAQLTGPSGESLRKDTTLLQSAATTDCKTIQVDTSELTDGSWKLVLKYSSNDTEGESSEVSFEIS